MDFYNFEKHNDLFCFEKLHGDYQPLFKTYKDSYQTSMNTFLKEYQENTELRFIESQLYFCNKEINIQKSIITSLEKLDHEVFYYVRNRIGERHCVYAKNIGDPFENETKIIFENSKKDVPDELKAPIVIDFSNDDNDDILDMQATSYNFIKFISNRITSLCLINEFLEQRKQEIERELIKISQIEPSSEILKNKEIDSIEFSFNNEFDNVNSKVVFDYFKKELVDKNYLSIEDLENYLKLSFEKKEIPKEKFVFKQNRTLKAVRAIFYNYFKNIAYKPSGRQPEYVKLLTDYFQGFEYEKVKNNFNK